jgi:hypothetical protein
MASTGATLQPYRRSAERWWCSHLVTITGPTGNASSQTVNMENISAGGACIAADTPFDIGDRLKLHTEGFETAVTVAYCNVRLDDFAVGLSFENGFRWSPDVWKPDHLLRPPGRVEP